MKKWICLLLSLCLTLGMVSGAVAAEDNRYLALGDSITAGTGLNEGEASFPQILAERNGYELNNQGIDGNTAGGLLATFADGSLDEAISDARLITITSGVSADRFGPGQTCTRGQIVTFLFKAYA